MEVGMLRRLPVPLVVVVSLVVLVSLAGCNQISEPVSNATRLSQSKWFIGVAVIGLLLAAWASWRMARDTRSRSGHGNRRERHANGRNRN
jgi:hypothetical protein